MTDDEKTTMTDDPTGLDEVVDVEDSGAADSEDTEDVESTEDSHTVEPVQRRRIDWARVLAFGILPGLALVLALSAGYLKYLDNSVRDSDAARAESIRAAKDSSIALLSYQPDTVEKQLNDARNLLTGNFQGSYTQLINDVVIPGAKQKKISAVATVPAAASVSAETGHAVVLVFINQTVVVGGDAPTDTASSVRVTLEKTGDKWLISEFTPV